MELVIQHTSMDDSKERIQLDLMRTDYLVFFKGNSSQYCLPNHAEINTSINYRVQQRLPRPGRYDAGMTNVCRTLSSVVADSWKGTTL